MAAQEKRVVVIDVDGRQGEVSAERLERRLKQLDRALDPLGVATRKYTADVSTLRAAQEAGVRTADQTAKAISSLTSRYDEQRRKIEAVTQAQQRANQAAAGGRTGIGGLGGGTTEGARGIEAQATAIAGLTTRAVAAAAAVAALAYSVKTFATEIATAGDEVRVLSARLNVVTGLTATSKTALDGVTKVAQSVGVGLADVGQTFARLAIASRDFGATSNDIARVTETVLKLGRIGGATQQELSSGAQQLGQALASGRLQGDELRSILENMPLVARAIAKEFGVTTGELKKMGEEGRLVSDRVFRALINAGREADDQFRQLPPTLEQAATRGANAFKLLYAAIDDTLGVSKFLASGLNSTADRATELAARIRNDINTALADTIAKINQLQAAADKARKDAASGAPDKPPGIPDEWVPDGRRPQQSLGITGSLTARPQGTSLTAIERQLAEQNEVRRQQEQQAATQAYRQMTEFEAEQQRAAEAKAAAEKRRADEAKKNAEKIVAEYDKQAAKAQKVAEKEKELQAAVRDKGITQEQANEILRKYAASLDKTSGGLSKEEKATKSAQKALDDYLKGLDREAQGLTETERERVGNNAALRAEELARSDALKLTESQITAIKDEAKANAMLAYDRKQANEEAKKRQEDAEREAKQVAERQAEAISAPWENAVQSLQSYVVEGLTGSFENAGQAIRGIWKRLMAEIAVATIIRPIIMQPVVSALGSLGLVPQSVVSQYGGGPVGSLLGGGGGLGGGGLGGSLFGGGNLFGFLNNPIFGPSSGAYDGVIEGMSGEATRQLVGASGAGGLTWGGALAGIGSIGMGAFNIAQGNTVGGAAGILGGGLGILGAAVPSLSFLGPIGMGIGLIGGLLGGLLKKKPKTPQAVTDVLFGDGGWTSSEAMRRGQQDLTGGTSKAGGSLGEALDAITGAYGLNFLPGAMGGYILNSIGKNTGNQWIVGLGSYEDAKMRRNGAGEIRSGLGSAEEAINLLAATIFSRNARNGMISGLSGTQQQIFNGPATFETIDSITKALDFSKIYDQAQEGAKVLSQYEQQLEGVKTQYEALIQQSKQYGLSTAPLEAQRNIRMADIANQMNTDARLRALSVQGPAAALQGNLQQLDVNRQREIDSARRVQEATGVAADIASIEQYYASERIRISKEAAKEQADAVTAYWDAVNRNVTQSEQTIRAIRAQYEALIADAEARGWDTTPLRAAGYYAQAQVGIDFNQQARLALLGINDPMAAQKEQLRLTQEARMKEAEAINRLVPGVVDFGQLIALNNAELKALEQTLVGANDNIKNALDRLRFGGDSSPYTLAQQQQNALREYQSLEAAAIRGDGTLDKNRLVTVADQLLALSKQRFSIGSGYTDLAQRVERLYDWMLDPTKPLPQFAAGGMAQPGLAIVGERGPELVRFNAPAQVYSNAATMALMGGGGDSVALMRRMVDRMDAMAAEIVGLRQQVVALTAVASQGAKAQRDTAETNREIAAETRLASNDRRANRQAGGKRAA